MTTAIAPKFKFSPRDRFAEEGGQHYGVSGHPKFGHPFTFAVISRRGNRDWRVENVAVVGAVAPGGKFASRETAAAALQADLDARAYAENERTRERPVTLAVINAVLLMHDVSWIDNIEQDANGNFRVNGRGDHREPFELTLNRAGSVVR